MKNDPYDHATIGLGIPGLLAYAVFLWFAGILAVAGHDPGAIGIILDDIARLFSNRTAEIVRFIAYALIVAEVGLIFFSDSGRVHFAHMAPMMIFSYVAYTRRLPRRIWK